ncbi:MAG: ATP-binding cassette domain-containing protein, partial [bacterium]
MAQTPLLQLENLKVDFLLRSGKVTAINKLDLQLERGKTLGLVGESGCGKSLTALAIMGLISSPGRITSGEIRFAGEDLLKLSERKRREL